jgi:hypothetical protein
MIYIVAGNYKEYTDYVYKNHDKGERYTYVQDVDYIRGLNEIKGFYIGTYFKRSDIDDIKERVAISKRISDNDKEINQLAERINANKEISYTNEYSVELVQQLDNNHVVDYKVNRLFSG